MGFAVTPFFRARQEIGFPAVPKCVEPLGNQMLYNAFSKHIPGFRPKLCCFDEIYATNNANVLITQDLNSTSPYACCRMVHRLADRLMIPHKLINMADEFRANRIVYDTFHNLFISHWCNHKQIDNNI